MRLRRVHGGRGTAFGAVAAALISALSLALPASAEAQGSSSFVTRSGTQLRLDGQAYRFTGINIYNANNASGCWYPLSNGPDLGASLDAIGGGAKVIRAWFFQALATSAGARDWNGIDHTLSVAAAHGVRVIATLGNQWIHCDGPAGGAGSYKDDAWYTNGYKQPDPAVGRGQAVRGLDQLQPERRADLEGVCDRRVGPGQVDRLQPPRQPRDDRRWPVRGPRRRVPGSPRHPDGRSL